jgi:hypothetical protein
MSQYENQQDFIKDLSKFIPPMTAGDKKVSVAILYPFFYGRKAGETFDFQGDRIRIDQLLLRGLPDFDRLKSGNVLGPYDVIILVDSYSNDIWPTIAEVATEIKELYPKSKMIFLTCDHYSKIPTICETLDELSEIVEAVVLGKPKIGICDNCQEALSAIFEALKNL